MKTAHKTYQKSSREHDREKLIIDNVDYVGRILSTMTIAIRDEDDRENLHSAGLVGLVKAANSFDFRQGVGFKTYAFKKIQGAIIDELRKFSPVSQSMLQQISQLKSAYETLDSPVSPEMLAEATGLSFEQVEAGLEAMRFLQPEDWNDFSSIVHRSWQTDSSDPEREAELKELRQVLAESIQSLPEREKLVITLYYSEELNLKEIGKVLDLSESGVSRALAAARFRLKEIVTARIK